MKSNETYLNQEVHEYKRLIVSRFNDEAEESIVGTDAQPCTDVPSIDISCAPDVRTENDIRRTLLRIMENRILSLVEDKMFTYDVCKEAINRGLDVFASTKESFSYFARNSFKEGNGRWYYHQVLETIVTDETNEHDVFAIEFRILGGYILKKDCTIHLFTKHLEEQVAFIMPYLEKGIKDYLKTKRDSV